MNRFSYVIDTPRAFVTGRVFHLMLKLLNDFATGKTNNNAVQRIIWMNNIVFKS